MMKHPEVCVIHHIKERMGKCSLKSLRGREGFTFLKAKQNFQFDATGYIVLVLDAPVITLQDKNKPFLLLDCTWRYLPQLMNGLRGEPVYRTLPDTIKTAYPRVSKIGENPLRGLASIEALYCALSLMGHDDPSLLDEYHWKDEFLESLQLP